MDEERRAQPTCPKASNPYHKCEEFCSNRTAEINPKGVKKETGGARPTCPKASNPYHKCEEFCSNRTAEINPKGVKKETGGARPTCPKASNPYHKCEELEFCSNRTAEANPKGIKKETGGARPTCPKASNPYHNCSNRTAEINPRGVKKQSERAQTCSGASNPHHKCDELCSNGTLEANPQGDKKESGSIIGAALSFGRKKKESGSQQNSPRAVNNVPVVKAARRGPSPLPTKKHDEAENSGSFSSSRQHSYESYSEDHSLDKGPVRSPGPMSVSGIITPDPPKSPTKLSLACYKIPTPAEPQQNGKLHGSPMAATYPSANHEGKVTDGPISEYLDFSFSGISRASEESDEEEVQSVISDSCVSVGKYHVRENIASILQLILDKYGDIAAGSRLESASMRAYYLECLCSVVHELQCTSFKQLTKSKVSEMLAVLKDVESAQIDVSWLRDILNDLAEGVELRGQHQAAEEAKSKCDHAIESINKELESMMEDLAQKEKAVADAEAQISETRDRLSKLELDSSRLSETVSSIWSTVEKFHDKPLADEIL
uniref:Phospholipase-like protein n=1 Tax=Populus davidiana TaxID=266767 RepID=A0A6M2F5V9_9ROSI